jgi:hypothetical protein
MLKQVCYLPMKAFGIVILSHILSRISSPESGRAMARTMDGISVFTVSWISSKGPAICRQHNKPQTNQGFKTESEKWHSKSFLQSVILMTSRQTSENELEWKQLSYHFFHNLHFCVSCISTQTCDSLTLSCFYPCYTSSLHWHLFLTCVSKNRKRN